jgi:hypothetical protein
MGPPLEAAGVERARAPMRVDGRMHARVRVCLWLSATQISLRAFLHA